MACPDLGPPAFYPFVQYALARMTSPPPRITQWYGGSVIGWTNSPAEAFMFTTAAMAYAVRAVLGSGIVVQVYSIISGELIGQC